MFIARNYRGAVSEFGAVTQLMVGVQWYHSTGNCLVSLMFLMQHLLIALLTSAPGGLIVQCPLVHSLAAYHTTWSTPSVMTTHLD